VYIILQLCKVYNYTQGLNNKPNLLMDPQGMRNWLKNDNYMKHLLTSNISTTKMMDLRQPGTSFKCWKQLFTLYENKTHDTIIAYTCNLHLTLLEKTPRDLSCLCVCSYLSAFISSFFIPFCLCYLPVFTQANTFRVYKPELYFSSPQSSSPCV
jgi:hypothetical protein